MMYMPVKDWYPIHMYEYEKFDTRHFPPKPDLVSRKGKGRPKTTTSARKRTKAAKRRNRSN